MTKADLLDFGGHHARLVHRKTWWRGMTELMQAEGIPLPGQLRKRA